MTKVKQEKSRPIKTEEGTEEKKVTKTRRAKSGARAKRQVKTWQTGKKAAISEAAWNRYLRLVLQDALDHIKLEGDFGEDLPDKVQLSKNATLALRGEVEEYVLDRFRRANRIRAHTKRVTLFASDVVLGDQMARQTFHWETAPVKTEVKQES